MSFLTQNFSAKAARQQQFEESITRIPLVTQQEVRGLKEALYGMHQSHVDYFKTILQNDITFSDGPAGVGKTFVSVGAGVCLLLTGKVQRLILSRPAVEAGEKLGFLPGDQKEKVDPYLRPLYDAANQLMGPAEVEKRMASGEIEIAPIAFLRGRTLADAFVVLDEAQNTTIEQMKMFTTRFGWNSTMVICGDTQQCDLPNAGHVRNGFQDAIMRHEGSEGIGVHRFDRSHVVRHPTVGTVLDNYEKVLPKLQAVPSPRALGV